MKTAGTLKAVGDVVPVTRPQPGGMPWGQPSQLIQQLWFSVVRYEWRSLAIVPVSPGPIGLEVANALSEVGGIHRRRPVIIFDALHLELKQVASMLAELEAEGKDDDRALVALDSPLHNLSGVPIARATDKILLVVDLGVSDLRSARRVLEMVGSDRVIGSVVFEGDRR